MVEVVKSQSMFVLMLLLAIFGSTFTFVANAMPPPDEIFAYVDGIGFRYAPHNLTLKYQKGFFTVGAQYDRVRYLIHAPGDLVYFGAACDLATSKTESVFKFVPPFTRVSSDESRVRLESQVCRGRYLEVSYKVLDWSDPSWIASNIAQANESWFICVLANRRTIKCGDSAVITPAENARIMSSLRSWIDSRGLHL